ncbi:MAG: 5,6-dimethylbenzimidazole synthase [Dehalococcoidia bacterium]
MDELEGLARAEAQAESFAGRFPEWAREAVFEAIYRRRDVRRFQGKGIPPEVLRRVLDAAHHAPSVGFMQPWTFILIRSQRTRQQVKDLFERERQAAACFYDEPRRSQYLSLKLEGIMESPLNICVTCDPTRGGEVLGRNSMPETDVYSTCLAVQNLWLAARAEGLGVGWVSILKTSWLGEILGIPPHIIPVAYLCIGYPERFEDEPLLQTKGWRNRLPLEAVLAHEGWRDTRRAETPPHLETVES